MKPKSAGNCHRSCHVQSRNSRNTGAWGGYGTEWSHLLPGRVPTPGTPVGQERGSHLLSRGVPAQQPQPAWEGVSSCHPLPLHQALEARQGAGMGIPQELHQRGQEAVQVPVRGLWGDKAVRGGPFPAPSILFQPPSWCPHLAGPRSSASLPAATPPPRLFSGRCWGGQRRGFRAPQNAQSPIRVAHAPTTMSPSPYSDPRWAGGGIPPWDLG